MADDNQPTTAATTVFLLFWAHVWRGDHCFSHAIVVFVVSSGVNHMGRFRVCFWR